MVCKGQIVMELSSWRKANLTGCLQNVILWSFVWNLEKFLPPDLAHNKDVCLHLHDYLKCLIHWRAKWPFLEHALFDCLPFASENGGESVKWILKPCEFWETIEKTLRHVSFGFICVLVSNVWSILNFSSQYRVSLCQSLIVMATD